MRIISFKHALTGSDDLARLSDSNYFSTVSIVLIPQSFCDMSVGQRCLADCSHSVGR